MGTPNRDRQRQFVARQRARGLRPHLIWLSDDQHAAVRELLQHAPTNGHDSPSSVELAATRDALKQAQSELAAALARIRDLETRLLAAPPPQALARIRDLESDLAQLSRANAALRANFADARRAARTAIAGVVVIAAIATLALLAL